MSIFCKIEELGLVFNVQEFKKEMNKILGPGGIYVTDEEWEGINEIDNLFLPLDSTYLKDSEVTWRYKVGEYKGHKIVFVFNFYETKAFGFPGGFPFIVCLHPFE